MDNNSNNYGGVSSPYMVLFSGGMVLLNAITPSILINYMTILVLFLTSIKLLKDIFKKGSNINDDAHDPL